MSNPNPTLSHIMAESQSTVASVENRRRGSSRACTCKGAAGHVLAREHSMLSPEPSPLYGTRALHGVHKVKK